MEEVGFIVINDSRHRLRLPFAVNFKNTFIPWCDTARPTSRLLCRVRCRRAGILVTSISLLGSTGQIHFVVIPLGESDLNMKRCDYCHEYIESNQFNAHCAEHEHLQADGQQEDYAALPPETRTTQTLEGEPQVYRHSKCSVVTRMSEDIIRSYLVNPYFYLADKTFCTGCGIHVPSGECIWIETGEDLQAHIDRLRSQKPEFRPGIFTRILVLLIHQKWIK